MRVILESLRFTVIFLLLSTILGGMTYFIYSFMDMSPEQYGWTAMIGALILAVALYKNRGWGQIYHKKVFWMSLTVIALLLLFIPAFSPAHLHTDKYVYSYGFPFKFLTLHIEDGSKFLIPNLFSGSVTNWSLNINLLGNFIIFYFALYFIFKNVGQKAVFPK